MYLRDVSMYIHTCIIRNYMAYCIDIVSTLYTTICVLYLQAISAGIQS